MLQEIIAHQLQYLKLWCQTPEFWRSSRTSKTFPTWTSFGLFAKEQTPKNGWEPPLFPCSAFLHPETPTSSPSPYCFPDPCVGQYYLVQPHCLLGDITKESGAEVPCRTSARPENCLDCAVNLILLLITFYHSMRCCPACLLTLIVSFILYS